MAEVSQEFFYPPRTFADLSLQGSAFETSGVVILPVPYASTIEHQGGSQDAPQAIIDASRELELFDPELGVEIAQVGIHTLPELQPAMEGPRAMIERVSQVFGQLLEKSKLVAMLGGEHSLTVGVVRACRDRWQEISVLQLDAHADLRDRYLDTSYSHACAMRRVLECCPVIGVGIRSLSLEEHQFLEQHQLKPCYAWELEQPGAVDRIVAALSPKVYITIDLDVFDPSLMPAVATPEPGGLGWQQVLHLLRAVTEQRQVVGFDVVELCPSAGPPSCAYIAAKLVYKLIGYITKSGRSELR